MREFTKEQVIEMLKEQAKILGHAPKRKWWREQGLRPGKTTIANYFGSWNKALEAAGLEPNMLNEVTRQMLLDDIKRVANEIGKPPKITEYCQLGKYTNIQSHGGWRSLIREIGFPSYGKLSRDDLIYFIRKVADELGHTPTLIEFKKHPSGVSQNPVYLHFGSYDELVIAAGLEPPQRKGGWAFRSKDELISIVQKLANELGYTPGQIEFTMMTNSSHGTVRYIFGSYSKFVRAAGLRAYGQFKGNDGHIISSRFELAIDNFLFENNIKHNVQTRVCKERHWTCDFVVGDIWIEADGYSGKRRGSAKGRWKEKLQYYQDNSYNLIVIRPEDNWKEMLLSQLC